MPIKHARITLRWEQDASVMFSENASRNGAYSYSLPDRPISIEVNAPGRMTWTYAQSFGENLTITALDHKTFQIELDTKQ